MLRAQQLLARRLQPHHRHHQAGPRRLRQLGQLLGRLAGGLHAPGRPARRHHEPHGLLHPAVVRQRRLHRRLPHRGHRRQRVAAAVLHPRQPGRRLVERRLEPGLLRRRRRPRRRGLPDRPVHDPRDHPAEPREAVPVPRPQGRLPGARAVRADRHPRHHLGRRPDRGPHRPAHRLLRREAGRLRPGHQQPARPRQAPAAHPRRLRRGAEHRGQACRTRSCSASAWPRCTPSAAPCR